jgi:hypothetical protein
VSSKPQLAPEQISGLYAGDKHRLVFVDHTQSSNPPSNVAAVKHASQSLKVAHFGGHSVAIFKLCFSMVSFGKHKNFSATLVQLQPRLLTQLSQSIAMQFSFAHDSIVVALSFLSPFDVHFLKLLLHESSLHQRQLETLSQGHLASQSPQLSNDEQFLCASNSSSHTKP